MRVSRLVVAVVLLAACSSGASTDTTSLSSSTSSSVPVTTTTEAPVTTTTSTLAGSTTTTLPGNWADLPLVVWDGWNGMALGWWDGTAWVQVSDETTLPISGDETYQVALLGSDVLIEGGPQHNLGCDIAAPPYRPGVEITDDEALSTVIDDGAGGERGISGVAVSAPWDIHPSPISEGEDSPEVQNAAFDILADLAFTTDSVSIVQVLETDLDGDGTPETLAVAESTELVDQASDVYSLVFAVSPSWDEPLAVAESVIPATEVGFPASFRVSDAADLTGDGVLEVIISGAAWEGIWVGVYHLTPEGFVATIGAGCGS